MSALTSALQHLPGQGVGQETKTEQAHPGKKVVKTSAAIPPDSGKDGARGTHNELPQRDNKKTNIPVRKECGIRAET